MDTINELIDELVKTHKVDLTDENVIFAFEDGYVGLALEDGELNVEVHFSDRVINVDKNLKDETGLLE